MSKLIDIFENQNTFSVEESAGDVNGSSILGKVKGVFFVPDGVSRNNRKYPKELWEKVCNNPDIRKRLEQRRMFGTIGHEQTLGDAALLEGKVSHIVTHIGIFNGQGIGEALILDTPAGRILNTLLRAGSKLFVSSRADGSYKGEDKGIPIVDPDTYQLTGWDFVLDPGFLQANPSLVEKFDQILADVTAIKNTNEGDLEMEAKLLESMAKENAEIKAMLERATTEIEALKSSKTTLHSENSHLRNRVDKQRKAETLLKKYEMLGTPEQIEKLIDLVEHNQKKWEQLGPYKQVYRALDKAEKVIREYQSIGQVKEINRALDASLKVVSEYKDLGKPHEIRKCFDISEKFISESSRHKAKIRCAELAKELKVSEDKVKAVYGKITEAEIKKLFANTRDSSTSSHYVKRNTESVNEGRGRTSTKSKFSDKTLGQRLMESYSGVTK